MLSVSNTFSWRQITGMSTSIRGGKERQHSAGPTVRQKYQKDSSSWMQPTRSTSLGHENCEHKYLMSLEHFEKTCSQLVERESRRSVHKTLRNPLLRDVWLDTLVEQPLENSSWMEPAFLRHALKKKSLTHGRATKSTTLVHKTLRMSTSRFMTLERNVVDPLASLPVECGWKDIPTQRRRFGANSDAVSVRKVAGLLLVYCAEDANSIPLEL